MFYEQAIKKKDVNAIKLFLQYENKWREKIDIEKIDKELSLDDLREMDTRKIFDWDSKERIGVVYSPAS